MPYLKQGSSILITSSLAGCVGNPCLVDYSASKGANQSFVKSLSLQLADKGVICVCFVCLLYVVFNR